MDLSKPDPTVAEYHHTRLEDPATYIRLLRLNPIHPDQELTFQISSWPVDAAPKYYAISYTWGEHIYTSITLNGQRMSVRQNCYDALSQAINYDKMTYLWVDSICINQDDIHEKSYQVSRMYDVYAHAHRVLSCVGSHYDDSERLVDLCHAMQSAGLNYLNMHGELRSLLSILSARWNESSEDKVLNDIHNALLAFANRPYWKRLWIVQEIIAGADDVQVLCGPNVVPWRDICLLLGLTETMHSRKSEMGRSALSIVEQFAGEITWSEGKVALHQVILQLSAAECADSRDRIYGLLALVDWDADKLEPIFPDYAKTAWQLAKELVSALGPHDCTFIMIRLGIDATNADLNALLHARLTPAPVVDDCSRTQTSTFGWTVAARLWNNEQGILCTDLEVAENEMKRGIASTLATLETSETARGGGSQFLRVYAGSRIVALACSLTRAGDLLISNPYASGSRCLILRHLHDATLDVVGTAWLLFDEETSLRRKASSFQIPGMVTNKIPSDNLFQCELYLRAIPEDFMLLYHRSRIEQDSVNLDQFLRMIPFLQCAGAATFFPRRFADGEADYLKVRDHFYESNGWAKSRRYVSHRKPVGAGVGLRESLDRQ